MNLRKTLDSGMRRIDESMHRNDDRSNWSPRRRPGSSVVIVVLLSLLAACSAERSQQAPTTFNLSSILGGDATAGYLRADAPRNFSFPQDHGPHEGFRNEWWYFTGNLETDAGRRFGYQVTFFNTSLPPRSERPDAADASAWHSPRIWMAHVALTDAAAAEHHAHERFSRENPGLAGATLEPFRVWLEDWQLNGSADGSWRLQVQETDFALDLQLRPAKAPVLQGVEGLSQKSPEPGNASYYYSITRIATRGSVRVGDEDFAVSGASWLDREWSTSALAADQSGWDWFSLQFDDGQELMYYQLRTRGGAAHPNSQGNWTDAAARQTLVTPAEITLAELDTWTSPAGVTYTTAWTLEYAGSRWRVEAVLADQLMNLSIPYWEGAVDIFDASGATVGRGYLEMVRD